jgi:hypothetical protein
MSAWIVSQEHIMLLVEALYRYEVALPDDATPDAIGQTLWAENHRSVNYRYDETEPPPPFTHDSTLIRAYVRQPELVYKQIDCYVYQSCEPPGWDTSEANRLMSLLVQAVKACLGKTGPEIRAGAAYSRAPWGMDEVCGSAAD